MYSTESITNILLKKILIQERMFLFLIFIIDLAWFPYFHAKFFLALKTMILCLVVQKSQDIWN